MARQYFWILFLGFLFGIVRTSFAQFKEIGPVEKVKFKAQVFSPNQKIQTQNTLPFWDDFSQGIDTLKWINSGTSYTETIGNNAPSLGMILFNGVDSKGSPYSQQKRDIGETDFFTSRAFDLSQLNPTAQNSLFISFFWQAGGKAEAPDASDEFTLEVLLPNKTWQKIWSTSGGSEIDRENFKQEIIKILPSWQHSEFQFRFLSKGRKNGPFDSWILDYVYLNSGRSEADLTYRDRALTLPNQVLINSYAGYPLALLDKNQSNAWSQVGNEFLNLENRFRAMEFSIAVTDSVGNIQTSINSNTPFNPVPNALERRSFLSREFEKIPKPQIESDLYFKTYLTSGDNTFFTLSNGDTTRYESVDFALNDTVSTIFPIRDFFAYDKGQADYSAGINQKGGQLAVAYECPEPVFIKGVSINFTNPSQANQAVDIVVWKDLSLKPIFQKEFVIPPFSSGDDFNYFSLDTNLLVNNTFYVGFTQFTNDFIHVGLDKTNDQADKVHYNVGGGWVPNEDVRGALMIRPHVSLTEPFESSQIPDSGFRIFPNPVSTLLTVEGEYEDITIFDSYGRQILLPIELTSSGEIINFEGQRPGIYIIKLMTGSTVKSFRIQVNK